MAVKLIVAALVCTFAFALVHAGEMKPDMEMAGSGEMKDLVQAAVEDGRFKTLVKALQAAEGGALVEALKGKGPFTVFAPTDDAFAVLLEEKGMTPEEIIASDMLPMILKRHVLMKKIKSTDLADMELPIEVETLAGDKVKVNKNEQGEVVINDSKVIQPDVEAKNGVIHVIDRVISEMADEDAMADTDKSEN